MVTGEEYIKAHYKIVENKGIYEVYFDGEIQDSFNDRLEAEDEVEDSAEEFLKLEYKHHCQFCNAYLQGDEVEHRADDNRFTAPYGSTIVWGGDIAVYPVCSICGGLLDD